MPSYILLPLFSLALEKMPDRFFPLPLFFPFFSQWRQRIGQRCSLLFFEEQITALQPFRSENWLSLSPPPLFSPSLRPGEAAPRGRRAPPFSPSSFLFFDRTPGAARIGQGGRLTLSSKEGMDGRGPFYTALPPPLSFSSLLAVSEYEHMHTLPSEIRALPLPPSFFPFPQIEDQRMSEAIPQPRPPFWDESLRDYRATGTQPAFLPPFFPPSLFFFSERAEK